MEIKEKKLRYSPSDSVQEIINYNPAWLVRWGTMLFSFFFLGLFGATFFISYPDVIRGTLKLTSTDVPKSVVPKTNGKLVRLFIKENEIVTKNQTLAYIESTANHDEILSLSKQLDTIQKSVQQGYFSALSTLGKNSYTNLGEIQPDYQQFEQTLTQLQSLTSNGFYAQKRNFLNKELTDIGFMSRKLSEQQQIYLRDYNLAQNEFSKKQRLARQGVVSSSELSDAESKLLAKQISLKQAEAQLINNQSEQTGKQKELLELDKNLFEQKNTTSESLKTLISAINAWKQKYIIAAPVAGKVFFQTTIQENQSVAIDQELFYIGSSKANQYIGDVNIPQDNFGKIKIGQKVIIRFNSYPAEEYGTVFGVMNYISEIPAKDNTYLVRISLPNGLLTTYNKKLTFRNGMLANVEIITEDRTLASKILYQFRRTFN
ncbi:HlyD family secretion protein [Emticicia sp.]|uniref:HlyD family secretion protein n=1 Tax=Emticicia sp. TaxID=1930953 RepID=UPI003752DA75